MGNSVPGPERKLASVVTVGATLAAMVGVGVGMRIKSPPTGCVVGVVAVVAVGVVVPVIAVVPVMVVVFVIVVGSGKDAISSSVATGRSVGAPSTRKVAIQAPLSNKYQLPLASAATMRMPWPPLTVPTKAKEISGPDRKFAVTGTVALISGSVAVGVPVVVIVPVGVTACVGVTATVGVRVAVAVGVGVGVRVGVAVAVARAVAVAVGVGGRIGCNAITLTDAVVGLLTVIETGSVTVP